MMYIDLNLLKYNMENTLNHNLFAEGLKVKNKKGFTLIELLVVISIIAVLMSILMPSLQKVRQMAKLTICQSNQKQIAQATILYAAEMDGKFPPNIALREDQSSYNWPTFLAYSPKSSFPEDHPLTNPEQRIVANYLGERVGDGEIFYCPLSPVSHRDYIVNLYDDIDYPADSGFGSYTCSYGIYWGGYTFYTQDLKEIEYAKNLSSKPTDILCADISYTARDAQVTATHKFDGAAESNSAGIWKSSAVRTGVDAITSSKFKSNYAFLDGHVEAVKGDKTEWMATSTNSDYNRFYFPEISTRR